MTITDDDLRHLSRCVELAAEAVAAGDEPFGSVLVGAAGATLYEERNRVNAIDRTHHPEFAIARWAAANLTVDERSAATVYTSGEHCAMCAAAHAFVGLGRIVYATSREQLLRWRADFGLPPGPLSPLTIRDVAPSIPADGPAGAFAEPVRNLHERLAAW